MPTPFDQAKEALARAIREKENVKKILDNLGPAVVGTLQPFLQELLRNSKTTKEELRGLLGDIQINVPKIDVPKAQVDVTVPKIPAPIVNVTVPPIKVPQGAAPKIKLPTINVPAPEVTVNVPDLVWPKDPMDVNGFLKLQGVDLQNPLPVQLRDSKGRPVNLLENLTTLIGGGGARNMKVQGFGTGGRVLVELPTGGSGLTDAELRALSVPISQVSGATFSVSVNDAFRTTVASNLINSDDRLRVSLETGGSGLTDAELRATAVPMSQVSGANWSVEVTGVVPGTAAASLGKSIDSPVGSVDVGVAMLAKHQSDTVHIKTAEGDYDIPTLSNFGALNTEPEQHHVIDSMNATTGWAATGNDTLNLATTLSHILGTNALTFDKVNGAANTVRGSIEKTITSVDLGTPSPHDLIQTSVYLSSVAVVDYIFVCLGTDSSNYNEWRISGSELTGGDWATLKFDIGDASFAGSTGNGWDPTAITYVSIGIGTNSESDTLSGIIFDEISFHTNQHTNASINSEVSSSVNSANINLQKINGSPTDKGQGNASNGSQRVVLATDDINAAAIKSAVEGTLTVVYSSGAGASVTTSGIARQTNPTPASDAAEVKTSHDDLGRTLTRPIQVRDLMQTAYVTASSEGEKTLLAGASGVFNDLVMMKGSNQSDAAIVIDIRQTTGGTVQDTLVIPAESTAGVAIPVPIPQDHADATWTVDNNSADASNTTYTITALFSKEV